MNLADGVDATLEGLVYYFVILKFTYENQRLFYFACCVLLFRAEILFWLSYSYILGLSFLAKSKYNGNTIG